MNTYSSAIRINAGTSNPRYLPCSSLRYPIFTQIPSLPPKAPERKMSATSVSIHISLLEILSLLRAITKNTIPKRAMSIVLSMIQCESGIFKPQKTANKIKKIEK